MRRPLTVLCVLLALQGVVGLDQYKTHLPTELVWVHVGPGLLARGSPPLWAACAGRIAARADAAAGRRRSALPAPSARRPARR